VDFLPVLRFAGQPISPRLMESAECSRYRVRSDAAPAETTGSSTMPGAEIAREPRWDWHTRFLWTGVVIVSKEVVGALPDGLRINWHLKEGSFAGPDYAGAILPGAADYMRIRQDGIGVVAVTELL